MFSTFATIRKCTNTLASTLIPKLFHPKITVTDWQKLASFSAVLDFRHFHYNTQYASKFTQRLKDVTPTVHNICARQLCYPQTSTVFPVSQRYIHGNEESRKRQVPRLIYLQNPMTWLVNKFDFRILRREWDNEFSESEFKKGTKQAISAITKMVSENCFEGLQGFFTINALAALQKDVETSWTDQKRRNIVLAPEDIQLAVPRRVHFHRILEQKFCDIDMVFIALKWADTGTTSAIVFVEIIARFHREYTEGRLPDWTISLFKVTRFNILQN